MQFKLIKPIMTSFNNSKDYADTERMIRIMKQQLIWSNGFDIFEQLKHTQDTWVKNYNAHYLYLALSYMPTTNSRIIVFF